MNNDEDIVITSAFRTPIGSFQGSLKDHKATELGTKVVKKCMQDSSLEGSDVDTIILGQVLQAGCGQNPARQSAINAGIDKDKTATTINQVCGSGLAAISLGFNSVKLKDSKVIIAGGQESMTNAPHYLNYRLGKNFSEEKLKDTMLVDGLIDVYNDYHMGITAENVAEKYQITRQDQDNFALNSQIKTIKAIKENKFKKEIVPIKLKNQKLFENDEYPRLDSSLEKLSGLKTVFKENGTVTAGNSSGLNDGAAAVTLMNFKTSKEKGLVPLVKIVSWAQCGVDPKLMGTGPIPASKLALKKAGWSINDLDLIESNEAFAAQSIAVIKELGLRDDVVNVNGGAIALGHPIGASGARILVTLIHEMKKRKCKKGLATLCIGGGMGIAMCIENI
jgi:acetyl-CoA C-acetyltransferase